MTDGDALLRAILTFPAEDTPRLVYADWLKEQGEPLSADRGEYIRYALDYAHHAEMESDGSTDTEYERELGVWPYTGWPDSAHTLFGLDKMGEWPPRITWRWHRGFISRIELPCAAFLKHAAAIFASHPVTTVVLSDVINQPGPGTEWFHLWGRFPSNEAGEKLLQAVRTLPTWFDTREDAIASLSAVCVTYARRLVGLPDLSAPEPAAAG